MSPVVDVLDVQTRSIHDATDQVPTLAPGGDAVTNVTSHSNVPTDGLADGPLRHGDDTITKDLPLNLVPRYEDPSTELPDTQTSPDKQDHADEGMEGSVSTDSHHRHRQTHFEEPESATQSRSSEHAANASRPNVIRSATMNMGFLPRLRRKSTMRSFWDTSHNRIQWDLAKSVPLKDLIPLLRPVQREFFRKLDAELDKVETFYVEREKEMRLKWVPAMSKKRNDILNFNQDEYSQSTTRRIKRSWSSLLCMFIAIIGMLELTYTAIASSQ